MSQSTVRCQTKKLKEIEQAGSPKDPVLYKLTSGHAQLSQAYVDDLEVKLGKKLLETSQVT